MIDTSKLPVDMKISEYTGLTQIPINESFFADDDGVCNGRYDKKSHSFIPDQKICEAISICAINADVTKNNETFVEFEFYSYTGAGFTTIRKSIAASILTEKEGIAELKKANFVIQNVSLFKNFINSTLANLNTLQRKGIWNDQTERNSGSSHYGFEINGDEINYDVFNGLDVPILRTQGNEQIDATIFKKKGSLEGFINYIDLLASKSPCKNLVMISTAIGLTGITRQFLGKSVAKPTYILQSPSGSAKGFIQHIPVAQFGQILNSRMIVSSGSSLAGLKPLKEHLYVLPLVVDDIQEKLDAGKTGIEEVRQFLYEHTNGDNTIKANSNRTINENQYTWENTVFAACEKEDTDQLKDGATARFALLKSGLKRQTSGHSLEYITGDLDRDMLDRKQHENYGWHAPAFIEKIREYNKTADIKTEFSEMKMRLNNTIGNDKIAALYALLGYTYNLLYKFDLLPKTWPLFTDDMILAFYDGDRIVSSDEQIYKLIVDRILDQPLSYIDSNIKLTQDEYDERERKNEKVRGRLSNEQIGDKMYRVCRIPTKTFNENIVDITKKSDLSINKINPKNWIENGWLVPNNRGEANHSLTNITRQYSKTVDALKSQENCYKIILFEIEDGDVETKIQRTSDKEAELKYQIEQLQKQLQKLENDKATMKAIEEAHKVAIEIPEGIDSLAD